ncbi:glycosyltransferase [Singulisphaera sp. Ch08]|uniref:Glycosyltransferase n=1 Tax=Singulisphaera sp. Ch08 TaxID=3120278 RepID=A0AAU7CCJ1_9BACT
MSQVDIIVPCYKYGHYLRQCVESVLTQVGVEARVLIVDDASPDDTPAVAAELCAQDHRVEYRRHSINRGHIATYNHGLEWVAGDYTVLLSADDLLTPGSLFRATKIMDEHPDVGLTFGRDIHFNSSLPSPNAPLELTEQNWRIIAGHDYLRAVAKTAQNFIPTPTVVVRTALHQKLGGYREGLPHSGDMELWMRFAVHANLAEMDVDQAYYRVHGQNMNLRNFGTRQAEMEQRKLAFDFLFHRYGSKIPGCKQLQRQVAACVSKEALDEAYTAFYKGDIASCRNLVELAVRADPSTSSLLFYQRLRWMLRMGLPLTLLARRLLLKPRLPRGENDGDGNAPNH